MKKIKVAISQRIIPHYRVPVFRELASRETVDMTVFYGNGFKSGSQTNARIIEGFHAVKLFTIKMLSRSKVWHPTLFFHLLKGKFDVVVVEPTSNLFNDIFAFIYCRIFGKKFIWHTSGSGNKKDHPPLRKIIDPLISHLIIKSDAYITYNSFADKYLTESFNIPPGKIFRAQNALDTKEIISDIVKYKDQVLKKKKELGLADLKVALFIGGIEKRKRINNLITAIYHINKSGTRARLLIVGDGQDLEWVKNNVTQEEKNTVVFAGKHIKDAVLFLLMSDVVVLPGQGGLSINHAYACGKPFIGTREGVSGGSNSIYDYVTDGYNGYVVKENDIPSLEEKLKIVLTDTELYQKLCKGALETSKKIDIPNMVNGFEEAIKYVMS